MQYQVYIINLKKRVERKNNIIKEFQGRDEFITNFIIPIYDTNPAKSLWKTIQNITYKVANETSYPFFILCEDDHYFTVDYNLERLENSIKSAEKFNADILLGGVSWFNTAISANSDIFWVRKFTGLQFTIIFRCFFQKLINTQLNHGEVADLKISSISKSIFVMFPLISEQIPYEYSDVTENNNLGGDSIKELFKRTTRRLLILDFVRKHYKQYEK